MHYIRGKEFAEYIVDSFKIEHGSIIVQKAEELGPEDEVYLFIYGPPYKRNGEKVEFNGKTGAYIFYSNWFHMSQEEIVKAIEKWHGHNVEDVVGVHPVDGGLEVLVRVPKETAVYWWDKENSN